MHNIFFSIRENSWNFVITTFAKTQTQRESSNLLTKSPPFCSNSNLQKLQNAQTFSITFFQFSIKLNSFFIPEYASQDVNNDFWPPDYPGFPPQDVNDIWPTYYPGFPPQVNDPRPTENPGFPPQNDEIRPTEEYAGFPPQEKDPRPTENPGFPHQKDELRPTEEYAGFPPQE